MFPGVEPDVRLASLGAIAEYPYVAPELGAPETPESENGVRTLAIGTGEVLEDEHIYGMEWLLTIGGLKLSTTVPTPEEEECSDCR